MGLRPIENVRPADVRARIWLLPATSEVNLVTRRLVRLGRDEGECHYIPLSLFQTISRDSQLDAIHSGILRKCFANPTQTERVPPRRGLGRFGVSILP